MAKMKAGPIVSDNGNFIIDALFPGAQMKDPLTVITIGSCCEFLLTSSFLAFDAYQDADWCCQMAKAVYFGNEVRVDMFPSQMRLTQKFGMDLLQQSGMTEASRITRLVMSSKVDI
jgi:hypothetical protein